MKHIITGALCLLVCLVGLPSDGFAQPKAPEQRLRVLYTAQAGYDLDDLKMVQKVFEDLAGVDVYLDVVDYADRYEQIREAAAAYDVLSLDQVWLADCVERGLLLPLDEMLSKKIRQDLEAVLLNAFQYQGQTWAFPFVVNFQLLYYNAQMLQKAGFAAPPDSLETLVEQMRALKEQGIVLYPWTDAWNQHDGLVAEFTWIIGAFGGRLFDDAGQPVFHKRAGVRALEFMLMLLKEQLANPTALTNDATAVKDEFISGQAAFTSNWLFQYGYLDDSATSEIVGQAKVALLPVSEDVQAKSVSVSASQGLAISAASVHPDLAWQWITFFTSPLVQRAFRYEMPIWTSVQISPDLLMFDPLMPLKRQQLSHVVHRPNLPHYQEASAILQKYLHLALQGLIKPSTALEEAQAEIEAVFAAAETDLPDDAEPASETE